MQIGKDKNSVYEFKFDSRPNQIMNITYDFYYNKNDILNTDDYDVDIQAIKIKGSDVDITHIVSGVLTNEIIERIIDVEQENSLQSVRNAVLEDMELRFQQRTGHYG